MTDEHSELADLVGVKIDTNRWYAHVLDLAEDGSWFETTDAFRYAPHPDDQEKVASWFYNDVLIVDRSGLGRPYGWILHHQEFDEQVRAKLKESPNDD